MTDASSDLCWIHIKDVYTFLYLGANPHERRIGQNVRVSLSVRIPYRDTRDELARTTDYGTLVERVQEFIEALEEVNLLEYLAEQVLDLIGLEFPSVRCARLTIHKGFVPLPHFTGSVAIEAERTFSASAESK
jgi:FolB domain-containing protein